MQSSRQAVDWVRGMRVKRKLSQQEIANVDEEQPARTRLARSEGQEADSALTALSSDNMASSMRESLADTSPGDGTLASRRPSRASRQVVPAKNAMLASFQLQTCAVISSGLMSCLLAVRS